MEWRHLSPVFCVWARWRNSRFRAMFFKSGVYIFSPEAGGTETKVESIATSLDHCKWASNCRSNNGVDWQARIKCERWRSMIFYDLSSRTWVVWDRTCNKVRIGRVYRGYLWHIWRKSGLEYGWWVVVHCGFPGHFFWDIICYFQISFIKCTRNTNTVSIYPPSTWHSPFAVVSLPLCLPVVAFPLVPRNSLHLPRCTFWVHPTSRWTFWVLPLCLSVVPPRSPDTAALISVAGACLVHGIPCPSPCSLPQLELWRSEVLLLSPPLACPIGTTTWDEKWGVDGM